ncbi:MAG TPA: fatty acid desaturase, partial [Thermoanaerobaculia bacterium]
LLGCLLIGCVLRIVVSHHGTFFINSLCHMIGRQPYSREHSARDSPIMAVLAFGEGYHNYHHSFPFDYRNGVKVWQFDPAKWMIWTLSRVGLARDLRRAPEAAVLKAKIEVQFENAKERLQKSVHDFREHHEARLQEAYTSLQTALHEVISLQRRQKPKAVAAGEEEMPHETRLGLTYRALEEAMQEWKRTLRQTKRLAATAA